MGSLRRMAIGLWLLAAGCATAEDVLSFEDFAALAHREPETGIYILNGDEPATGLAELRAAYDRYRAELDADGVSAVAQPLIVHQASGQDDRWSDAQRLSLTYCVNQRDFGKNHAAVVRAMADAAAAWESVADVEFVHLAGHDAKGCDVRNASVVFDVRETRSTEYLARAFFPSFPRRDREIRISTTAFGTLGAWTLTGILRHELGHVLGFRHEHTRPEAGTCFEDTSWRALTDYDSASVMHYPQCNGTQAGDLVITERDAAGAAALYGAPR